MYPDSPESRDVPPQARSGGPSPVRVALLGGLVGGIGVMVTLLVTGAIAVGGRDGPGAARSFASRTADEGGESAAPATDSAAARLPASAFPPAPAPVPAPAPAPAPAATPPPLTLDERIQLHRTGLQQAVLRADEAEIEAMRRLDPAPLYAAYTGSKLQEQLDQIEELRGQNLHVDAQLTNLEWISFWVSPDERTARVEVRETWYTQIHSNADDSCVAEIPTHEVPQRASLRRVDGTWKVENVTFYVENPQPQAC